MTRKEQIEQAAVEYQMRNRPMAIGGDAFADMTYRLNINPAFVAGAEWADSHVLKPADGDDLPDVDREVIALVEENEHYKVVYAHRPPEYWDGKNILTGEVTRYYPKRYDKGNWNQPDVKWWLDIEVPKTKMEEEV